MLRYLLETIAELREEHDARARSPGRTRRCPRIAGRWTGPPTTSRRCRETLRPVLNTLESHRRRALDR